MLLSILKDGRTIKNDSNPLKKLYMKVAQAPDQAVELRTWMNLNPEPKIDEAILESRTPEVRRNVKFLTEEILKQKHRELNYKDVLALERVTRRIIEAMLDVCRHLVSIHSLGLAESYGEYPMKLALK